MSNDQTETETRFMCKPCGKTFPGRLEAENHANRHRGKAYHSVIGKHSVTPDQLVRQVEIETTESEETTLHETVGEEPPEETDPEIIGEPNDRPDTQRTTLYSYE